MATGKRASMREGPLADLFRKTDEQEARPDAEQPAPERPEPPRSEEPPRREEPPAASRAPRPPAAPRRATGASRRTSPHPRSA